MVLQFTIRFSKPFLKSEILKFEISKEFSGGSVERVTPVPIPNTEVKPLGADGTALEAAWESRKPPGYFPKSPRECYALAGFCL